MSLVSVRNEGRVRVLTLNRPDQRNALNAAIRTELISAIEAAEADATVGALVLTGAGKCFAAGADLGELLDRSTEEQKAFLEPPHMYSVIEGASKPVLAAINGHALGAGLELATACDMRIATPKAKLGQPEIHLAIIPGGGGTQRLVRLIGKGHASRLVLTGDAVGGQEAHAMGLVDVLDAEPVDAAIALAAAMARHDPEAIATGKAALHAATTEAYGDGLDAEIQFFLQLHAREAAKDRMRNFLER